MWGVSGPARGGGAAICRMRSTPPTPRSGGTYLYVSVSVSHLHACGVSLTMLWCGIPDTSQDRCRVSVSMRLELAVTSRTYRQVVWIFICIQIRFFVCLFVKVQDLWRPIASFDFIRIPSFIHPPIHLFIPIPIPILITIIIWSCSRIRVAAAAAAAACFDFLLVSCGPDSESLNPPAVDSHCNCIYSIRINTSGWRRTYVRSILCPRPEDNLQ